MPLPRPLVALLPAAVKPDSRNGLLVSPGEGFSFDALLPPQRDANQSPHEERVVVDEAFVVALEHLQVHVRRIHAVAIAKNRPRTG